MTCSTANPLNHCATLFFHNLSFLWLVFNQGSKTSKWTGGAVKIELVASRFAGNAPSDSAISLANSLWYTIDIIKKHTALNFFYLFPKYEISKRYYDTKFSNCSLLYSKDKKISGKYNWNHSVMFHLHSPSLRNKIKLNTVCTIFQNVFRQSHNISAHWAKTMTKMTNQENITLLSLQVMLDG